MAGRYRGFGTKAVHVGQEPDATTGAVVPPVHHSSTYALGKGYRYSRIDNPTRLALEDALAALEDGRHGLSFSSGQAAGDAALGLLSAGEHVVAGRLLYGGTHRLLDEHARLGVGHTAVDSTDLAALEQAFQPGTRLVWIETPSNPLLDITDIAAVADIAHRHGARLLVDSTFASPYLQQPLKLGADIVLHSATKFLNGHADAVGGALVVDDDGLYGRLRDLQGVKGGVPGPDDCERVRRGMKTLEVRMLKHCENAYAVANYLLLQPDVDRVIYPGHAGHPGHALAQRQMRGYGGMISVVLKGGLERSKRFVQSAELFVNAVSLGGVESLLCRPAGATHAGLTPEYRQSVGLPDELIRLSVGIEDPGDIIGDLEQAIGRSR
jgi:cystathionine gamma-lyase